MLWFRMFCLLLVFPLGNLAFLNGHLWLNWSMFLT
ncbi:hypothetical protein T4B_2062 [Trichinella pseudospiralis]|uniref:Uncharacterized protein n=1 Tax=Trichinella pseudospiralis TaxID=6337 RepID=A0A0V1GD90_TRIPS|nr:hypothetical protein T4B_2062 [Trichinella pseudospiralis]